MFTMFGDVQPKQPPAPGVFPGGCVLLVPPEMDTPQALVRALGSRELSAKVVHDEPAVMEALSEMDEARRVLVVVEPDRWPRLAELVHAVRSFHGSVLCWQYKAVDDSPGRLSMLDHTLVMRPQAKKLDQDALESETGPIGQILGHRRRPLDKLLTRVPGRPLTSREIVTQQELTMLLGPAPGEAG